MLMGWWKLQSAPCGSSTQQICGPTLGTESRAGSSKNSEMISAHF